MFFRFYPLAGVCFVLALVASPVAIAQTCNPTAAPIVRIVPMLAEPQINDRLLVTDLQAKYAGAPPGSAESFASGHLPLGLTSATLKAQLQQKLTLTIDPAGPVCATLQELTVEIGFENLEVFVARDLPRRSCSYTEVMAHEYKHVNTDRRFLQNAIVRLQTYWQQAANNIQVVHGASRAEVEQVVGDYLNNALTKVMAALSAEREQQQMKIDTPEEYERVTQSCDGEIIQILEQRYGRSWLDAVMANASMRRATSY